MALGSTQLHGSDGLKQLKRLKLSQDRCQGKGRSLPEPLRAWLRRSPVIFRVPCKTAACPIMFPPFSAIGKVHSYKLSTF